MPETEAELHSPALRRGATVVGITAALPAGYLGSSLGSNLMAEVIGDETMAEIHEARKSQDREALREHTPDMLGYIVGTAVITLLAATTAYGYTKNRALKKWGAMQSKQGGREGVVPVE